MCQRWSGGLFACFPAAEATVTVAGPVTEFQSSALARRAFCSRCGTQLWMRDVTAGADYDLLPGIFDAAKDWPLTSEIYCDQAMAAFALAGDHKRATAATYREKNPAVAGIGEESDA